MKKLLTWIRTHRRTTVMLFLAVLFCPLLITHVLFKIHSNCYWIEAEWEAGDLLGYFGDVLSFVGTVVLGYIAIAQAERANELNNELLIIEENRIKPCFDISSSQLYKIFLANDMFSKLSELNRNQIILMDILYTSTPRSGIETSSALIELDVINSGFTDIRRIFVKSAFFYMSLNDPYNRGEMIALISGNTALKIDECKKLYIHVKREVCSEEELNSQWYEENINKLTPHMEFELILETADGNSYFEKITCGSGWDISMKNINNIATRSVGVVEVCVNRKK